MDTPAQCCIQETHLKRKFENKACGKLHQANVCKQKAGTAESKLGKIQDSDH